MDTANTITTTKGTFPLCREEFPDIGVAICLPEDFHDLPNEEKPQSIAVPGAVSVVRADMENKFVFTINSLAVKVEAGQTEGEAAVWLVAEQQKILSHSTPNYQEFGVGNRENDGHTIALLRFASNSSDGAIYNVSYVCIHEEKMILGTFSCPFSDYIEWDVVFSMCLGTLRFI
ncbi:MAG: hypothetical protein FWF33_05155 [Clostridiales bacterium]|nr:hypothetical protein [Clostridiales bacterium]